MGELIKYISAEDGLIGTEEDDYLVTSVIIPIEQKVIDYLNEHVNAVAFAEQPETVERPGDGRFLVVEKTGSSLRDFIHTAVIAVQSYAPTLYDAAILNEVAKQAVLSMIERDDICKVTLNSDYNFTNPETKQPRYQAVFEIIHY